LVFRTRQRKTVETAGASIGLGETLLIVDANGAYRGQQTYQVNNTTEQFLEIQLPPGARLWTATVSGQPVKPTQVPGATDSDRARIPLIKTAEGDLDYPVVLKYGGHLDSKKLRTINRLSFPFIHTVNINVELSQVRLRLPETYRWFDFDGSMRQVEGEADYAADFLLYNRRQAQRLLQVFNKSNPYAKVRAANNMKQIGLAVQNYHDTYERFLGSSTFKKNLDANASIVESARQQTEDFFEDESQVAIQDNRGRLNSLWFEQKNDLARNVVNGLPGNFDATVRAATPQTQSGEAGLNYEWLSQNQLRRQEKVSQEQVESRLGKAKGQLAEERAKYNEDQTRVSGKSDQVQLLLGEVVDKKPQGRASTMEGKPAVVSKSQQTLAREYYRQLEQQQAQAQMPAQGGEYAQSMEYAGQAVQLDDLQRAGDGESTASVNGRAVAGLVDQGAFQPPTTPAMEGGVETRLASLDVDLPQRGVEFLFRTTRGDIAITARSVSQSLLSRLIRLGILAAALIVIVAVWKLTRRIGPQLAGSVTIASLLVIVALLILLLGIFPIAALIALVVGIIHLSRLVWLRRRRLAAA
jgi:hypothetical protein